MTGQRLWRPTRRRLTDTLLTALVPVVACGVTLGGLTTWVAFGNAGSPARIEVPAGRVFLPYGDARDTAAFFRISNSGDAKDRLVDITSSALRGDITLSRHRTTSGRVAYRETVDSAVVPANGSLTMSPHSLNVTVRSGAGWTAGDLVPFTLHFQRSGQIKVLAIVVRPGEGPL
ncbi:copper chaperone PCu(A)C [Streptomyces sp. ALI-76-A]|jgi:copper(I)-binding protein|uniref:copper chaperone PCu(A)C n=1 Tax=Streptomyces sp. ALI-76-A TaxID=3025736 RepID=UPI00256EDA15|nr:copper chaperone PCu(A)C [Streptomyces sp. ALI-76-A]MDL5199162.1 copper chaperone PCu(A)C [Streptomyces sp. ALI-76-A]